MKTPFNTIFKKIDKAEEQIRDAVQDVIIKAEKDLKGEVCFLSKQEYDDNNYYTSVTINTIDGTYINNYDVMHELHYREIALKLEEAKTDPKLEVKDILKLRGDDTQDETTTEKVINYCLKKNISAKTFFDAFVALDRIKQFTLPDNKVESE